MQLSKITLMLFAGSLAFASPLALAKNEKNKPVAVQPQKTKADAKKTAAKQPDPKKGADKHGVKNADTKKTDAKQAAAKQPDPKKGTDKHGVKNADTKKTDAKQAAAKQPEPKKGADKHGVKNTNTKQADAKKAVAKQPEPKKGAGKHSVKNAETKQADAKKAAAKQPEPKKGTDKHGVKNTNTKQADAKKAAAKPATLKKAAPPAVAKSAPKSTARTAEPTKVGAKSHGKTAKTGQNSTKSLYGVKGIKLVPTKVSNKKYSYREKGKTHTTIGKEASRQYSQTGVASYYGGMFHGRKTANGEIFNKNTFTAAHKTLALGSYALVTNLRNGRKVIVKINDRGPFSKSRIIDLSVAAAREIGMLHSGVSRVRVDAMQVDAQGYISGKGAEALLKLAKKAGLPLKIKGEGKNLAIKAE